MQPISAPTVALENRVYIILLVSDNYIAASNIMMVRRAETSLFNIISITEALIKLASFHNLYIVDLFHDQGKVLTLWTWGKRLRRSHF